MRVGTRVGVTERARVWASGSGQTDGWTPLCIASKERGVEVVKALVGAGAAVNQATVRDHWSFTVLMESIPNVLRARVRFLCYC